MIELNKLKQWEYWPSWVFYAPLIPYLIFKVLKSGAPYTRSLDINSMMPFSGLGGESKFDTLRQLPSHLVPESVRIDLSATTTEIQFEIENLGFPIILKPDVGFRGYGVYKIDSKEELINKIKELKIISKEYRPAQFFIAQEFIQEKEEYAVLVYIKDGKTQISSLTQKEFLHLKGNGKDTLEKLIDKHPRAQFYKHKVNIEKIELSSILAKDELFCFSAIGNHSRGTKFIDLNHEISDDLRNTFSSIVTNIPGFNYGRFDLKAHSLLAMTQGKFKLMELNGIMGEPAHIYDPDKSSYIKAIYQIKKHWAIIDSIAQQNVRQPQNTLKSLQQEVKRINIHKKFLEQNLA
ncbi:MAG: ATP-grasp domain-containing protein [Flavobacteriaceae bacterium]